MIDKSILDYIKGLKNEKINSPEKFIPSAAQNAKHITCTTHPCQFSHPFANQDKDHKVTPIIFPGTASSDGYVRSGNIKSKYSFDMYGSAGYVPIMKFLAMTMSNGKTVLDNIKDNTPEGKELLNSSGQSADELREQFMEIFHNNSNTHITSSKIKQVYFHLEEGQYHLLSLLTPSTLIYELKNRISTIKNDAMLKKEQINKKREATNSFKELYNLITLRYGGTKPQNISYLNNENAGVTNLLCSLPPTLVDHQIRLPKRDFFSECLNKKAFKWEFDGLYKLITLPKDSPIPLEKRRKFRDRIFKEIILSISEKLFVVREALQVIPNTLKASQQIWLNRDEALRAKEKNDWEGEIANDMARWIIVNLRRERSAELGDTEMAEIKNNIQNYEDLWK